MEREWGLENERAGGGCTNQNEWCMGKQCENLLHWNSNKTIQRRNERATPHG